MTRIIAIDTETTGLNIFQGARPFLFIQTERIDGTLDTIVTRNIEDIKEDLENPSVVKIMHNAKFDLLMFHSIGIEVKGQVYDTMIASHLLDETSSNSLKNSGKQEKIEVEKLSDSIDDWFKEKKIKKGDRDYSLLPDDIIMPYAKVDGELTLLLWEKYEPKLKKEDTTGNTLWNLFIQECELIHVLVDMFKQGLKIDIKYFKKIKSEYIKKMEDLETEIYRIADTKFDILSVKQLGKVLLNAGVELPKTEKENYSTRQSVLENIDHPLVKLILDYRHKSKFLTTYIDVMINENTNSIIHSNLWSTGARTGRFSCSEPNLQQIPSDDLDIKRGFIVRDGFYNFYIDYKQQEYRVFTDYAKENDLIKLINEEDMDFHTKVYEELKDYLPSRKATKSFNFMLIYGGGPIKLAEMLQLQYNEGDESSYRPDQLRWASKYILKALKQKQLSNFPHWKDTIEYRVKYLKALDIKKAYFTRFKNVDKFLKSAMKTVENRGYIFNKYNRKRRLKKEESYKAVNYLVQGSCADFIKAKMVKIWKFLKPYKSNLLMNIHDELVFEISKDELFLIPDIVEIMEDSFDKFNVRLGVDVEYTDTNWAEKKEFEFERKKYTN